MADVSVDGILNKLVKADKDADLTTIRWRGGGFGGAIVGRRIKGGDDGDRVILAVSDYQDPVGAEFEPQQARKLALALLDAADRSER